MGYAPPIQRYLNLSHAPILPGFMRAESCADRVSGAKPGDELTDDESARAGASVVDLTPVVVGLGGVEDSSWCHTVGRTPRDEITGIDGQLDVGRSNADDTGQHRRRVSIGIKRVVANIGRDRIETDGRCRELQIIVGLEPNRRTSSDRDRRCCCRGTGW